MTEHTQKEPDINKRRDEPFPTTGAAERECAGAQNKNGVFLCKFFIIHRGGGDDGWVEGVDVLLVITSGGNEGGGIFDACLRGTMLRD